MSEEVRIRVFEVPGVMSAATLAQAIISSLDNAAAKQNTSALDIYNAACRDWAVNNIHNRDLGQPLTPKPTQPPAVHSVSKIEGQPGALEVVVTTSAGPDFLGAVCPDLPPVTPSQPLKGNVQIGIHNFGFYWAQGPQDNPPDDVFAGKPFSGTSMDAVSGMWMFVASPLSSDIYGRKGWYMKLS